MNEELKQRVETMNKANRPFHTRIQVTFDWDASTFRVELFINNEWQSGENHNFSTAVSEIELLREYYGETFPIYTYGKWIADRLWEKAAIQALWF